MSPSNPFYKIHPVTREQAKQLLEKHQSLWYFTVTCECERVRPNPANVNDNWQMKKVYFLCDNVDVAKSLNTCANFETLLYVPVFNAVNSIGFTPDSDFEPPDPFMYLWAYGDIDLVDSNNDLDWLVCFIDVNNNNST